MTYAFIHFIKMMKSNLLGLATNESTQSCKNPKDESKIKSADLEPVYQQVEDEDEGTYQIS